MIELPPDVKIELAFGANLQFGPHSWPWTDVTGDLLDQSVSINRGQANEAAQASPATASFELDNPDGNYTPGLPSGIHFPNVRRNTPCRIWVPGGAPALVSTGPGGIATPDDPTFSVTDLDVAVELSVERNLLGSRGLAHQYVGAGDQRGWQFFMLLDRRLALQWSPDGTDPNVTIRISEPVPPDLQRLWVRVMLDVDDGGLNTVTWLTSPDGVTWDEFDSETQLGTTTVFDSSASLVMEPAVSPGIDSGGTRIHQLRWLDGLDGVPIADPDFAQQEPGTASFTDLAGNTWTTFGAGEITTRRVWFFGQVSSFQVEWPYGDLSDENTPGESRVQVEATGITRRLDQRKKTLQSTLHRVVTAPFNSDRVLAYWPGEDGSDAATIASPIEGVSPMTWGGALSLASDDSLSSSLALPNVSGGLPAGWNGRIPGGPALSDWAVDLFVNIPTAGGSSWLVTAVGSTLGRARDWTVFVNNTQVSIGANDEDGGVVVLASFPSDPRFFNTWALVRLELTQNGGNVDWQVLWVPIPLGSAFGTGGSYSGQVGRPSSVRNLFAAAPPDGVSIGHWIVSTNMPLGSLAPADTAFNGEPATNRYKRLCDEQDVPAQVIGPAGGLSIPTWADVLERGVAAMGPQRPVELLELLQECVDADLGVMWEEQGGPGLIYRSGATLTNQEPSVELDGARNGDIDNPFTPTLDDQRIRNDVTVARQDGSSYRVADDESVAAEDLYDEGVTLNVWSDAQLPDQAGWRLHLGSWPGMRYSDVASNLAIADEATIEAWLDADLGDVVSARNLPPQHSPDDVNLMVRGTGVSLSLTGWVIDANCTPADPWLVAVRDEDETAKRDTDLSVVAVDFDVGTDTSMTVVSANLPWTTEPGEFPFDLNVGGVRLTVTAISGASSPQTFTITPTPVNGIEKTLSAGTEVHVWRAAVRAL